MKYQIQSYQIVYGSGQRDTVKLPIGTQIIVDDLDKFRKLKKAQHPSCIGINLTYVELYDIE